MNFEEQNTQPYDWENEGVYVIAIDDYVEGGEDGVSNRQAKELTKRTRNLHKRMTTAEGEIDALQDEMPIKAEAMLRASKEYTDGKDSAVRRDMATADTATLRSAKDYADTIVAALVDNTPEALNTLQELATALGNNPNFATDVLQAIGERATMAQVNAALEGKANKTDAITSKGEGTHLNPDNLKETGYYFVYTPAVGTILVIAAYPGGRHPMQIFVPYNYSGIRTRSFDTDAGIWSPWVEIYHSGNLTPQTIGAMGLYTSVDANTITNTGYYTLQTGTANLPFGVGAGDSLLNLAWDNNAANQIITEYSRDKMWMRRKITGAWQPWVELIHSGNMQCGVIGGGRVYAGGGSSNYGRIADVLGTGVQGQYRIVHNLGHTNYSLTGNVFYGGIAAFLMILTYGLNDIVVEVRDVQSHPQRLDFMYTISGRF